jgi:nitrate reductase alpha subunit
VVKPGDPIPPIALQKDQLVPENLRNDWDDFMVWDYKTRSPKPVTRDHVGEHFTKLELDPALEGEFEVKLLDGRVVKVRPVFDLLKEYLESFDPYTVSEITWAPPEAVEELARLIAANKTKTLFVEGMGPNHFYHSDLKDRGIILVASLTNNIGHFGGTVGSYAGNYRMELLNGVLQWVTENPFDIVLEPDKPAKQRKYWKEESAHYYAYDDRPLRIGGVLFTGKTHMPTPTKATFWGNSNSILGNSKWAHNIMVNTLPKIEMIVVTTGCGQPHANTLTSSSGLTAGLRGRSPTCTGP